VLALLYLAGFLVPQAPAVPTFSTAVELVTVDAVVLDGEGNPVGGLTQDDFVVTEDGKRQEIVGFEAFGTVAEPAGEPTVTVGGAAAAPEEAPRIARAFAIVLDDLRLGPTRAEAARQGAKRFLESSLRDGDLVSLGTTSGTAWWSARLPEGRDDLLAVLGRIRGRYVEENSLDRMTDYEAHYINLNEAGPPHHAPRPDRPGAPVSAEAQEIASGDATGSSIRERVKSRWMGMGLCSGTSCDAMVRQRAAEIDTRRQYRTRDALLAVRRALGALAPVRGRKSLLFFSESMIEESTSESRAAIAAAREVNTAVYFVDVRGLVALPGGASAADNETGSNPRERFMMGFENSVLETAGARALAEETGGFSVRNSNDFAAGADRIAAESRVFYLLGFYAPDGKGKDKWRKLRVQVKRAGLTVRARRGYTLRASLAVEPKPTKEAKAPTLPPAMSRALDSALEDGGIPVRAMAYVLEPRPGSAAHVVVTAEFDAGSTASLGSSADRRFEVSIVVTHRDTGRAFAFDGALRPSPSEGEDSGWRAVVRDFELPPGVAQARIVVRDAASGALGSASRRFEVPGGPFYVTTPVLTDEVEPVEGDGSRPRPVLTARRVFKPEGRLYCQFEVFGAAGQAGGAPRVAAGLVLRDGAGRVVFEAPLSPIAPDSDGRVVRLMGVPLQGLAHGSYELDLDVQDEESGAWIERREPFELAPSSPGSD
jgi:VWFA-related protein